MDRQQTVEGIRTGAYDFLRYLWCDNGNVIRAKSLFLPAFLAHYGQADDETLLSALEAAATITAAMLSVPATRDAPAPEAGLAPVEDVRLSPAWEALVESAVPHRALSVVCTLHEGPTAWQHCPRTFLQEMVARLADHGLELHVGLELEFYLLHPAVEPGAAPLPLDQTVFAQSLATQIAGAVSGEIARTLWRQGIPVEQVIAESGAGQQEITLEHCGPLVLADRLVHARETIHGLALENDLIASFLPLIFEGGAGSGLHTHMSLWEDDGPRTADPGEAHGIARKSNAFMAGILAHLPALMAVTTPTRNSYRRIRPHAWSGAYQAWGIENKEAALRLVKDARSGSAKNFEFKTMDGTANPYLALGTIIAAGLDGLEKDLRLPAPAPIDPGDYTDAQRAELGIRPLPATSEHALAHFKADEVLQAAMGAERARVFTAVRRAELETLADLSFAEERDLLLQRY